MEQVVYSSSPPSSPALASRAQRRRTVIFGTDPDVVLPRSVTKNVERQWVPSSLKTSWMVANIVLLLVIAVVLEILLKVNHDSYGWGTPGFWNNHESLHIVWTALPGLAAFLIVQQWVNVDMDVKLLQPYVDMSHGSGETAEKTVLLDYQRQNAIFVQIPMIRNKHYIPLITNGLCLLAIAVSPLASAYLYLQTPSDKFTQALNNVTVVEQLGLQDPIPYANLHAAAGFSIASSVYGITPPPFIRFLSSSAWTASRISVSGLTGPGTIKAHTVCMKSIATCSKATTVFNPITNSISGSIPNSNTTSNSNCAFSTFLTDSPGWVDPAPFGIVRAICPSSNPALETSSVAFYMVNGTNSFAAICRASLAIQRADVLLNSTTSALIAVTNQTPLEDGDVGGIDRTKAPYNGSAFNALLFTSIPTPHATAHLNATLFSLGHAMNKGFQHADPSSSNADAYLQVVADAYGHYLGMVAQDMYYQPVTGTSIDGTLHLDAQRLFVSAVVTHILFALFIVMAIGGTAILILHRRARRGLVLASQPGTLAAAVSVAGNSDLPHLLDGKDTDFAMRAMLSDLHFGLDKETGRVRVAEAPQGYADVPQRITSPGPLSPNMRRTSFFNGPTSPGPSPGGRQNGRGHFSPPTSSNSQQTTFAMPSPQIRERPVPRPIQTDLNLVEGSRSESKESHGSGSGPDVPHLEA